LSQIVTVNPGTTCASILINNTFYLGCLEVIVTVDWGVIPPDLNQIFNVSVTGSSKTTYYHEFGYLGGSWIINNLIPGTYWVNETDPGSSWIVTVGTQTVTIDSSCWTVLTIHNEINPGCLEITKTVDWGSFTTGTSQTFNVTVTGPSHPTGISHSFGYTGGTWTLNNLIPGSYNIAETDPGQYWDVTPGLNQTVTVNQGTPCGSISITNTYDPCTELKIEKYVWNGADWTDNVRVPVGEFLNFKIIIQNIGILPATNIIVTDILASPQLEYRNQANYTPDSESSNLVIWSFDLLEIGESIEITYVAETVHTCYGWNLVNVTIPGCKSYEDEVIVKVVLDGQPIIDIKKQVWDTGKQDWTDSITRTIGSNLSFKLSINSTALETIYDINIVDDLPDLLEYRHSSNYDEEYLSDDLHQIIWNFDSIDRGENIEIFYNAETVETGWDDNIVTISNDQYYDEDSVLIKSISVPLMQLTYPKGGETLNGNVMVRWLALDSDLQEDLSIYLYYSGNNGNSWINLDGPLYNTNEGQGEYNWDTLSLSDGDYRLKAVAFKQGVATGDTSEIFTVNNGIVGAVVSNVVITDIDANKIFYVKDRDTIKVTAGITGASDIVEVYADLSGFGSGINVLANSFDGFTAIWTLNDVICHPREGIITVTVNLDNDNSNSATITADNTNPTSLFLKPVDGFYFFNSKLLPIGRTIIIGAITVEVDGIDNSGIDYAEFYLDGELHAIVNDEHLEWYMNIRLQGNHQLEVIIYDNAGNSISILKEIRVFNFFGD
jgi:uncharacterized repeat protein (TIGR01451 family)